MALTQKIAFITGAGRGVGAAVAKLFAERGARVALVSRTRAELESVAQEIEALHPGHSMVLAGDISSEAFVREAFAKVKSHWGPVTTLVNNAAILRRAAVTRMTAAAWDETFGVNVRGSFLCAKEAFLQMQSAGGGSIVNISSLAGIRGTQKFADSSAYVASKHAVVGLTEALSVEGKALGIRVNCVAPGAINTRMLAQASPELKSSTGPADIAPLVAYLCDETESGVLTGSVIEVHSNE